MLWLHNKNKWTETVENSHVKNCNRSGIKAKTSLLSIESIKVSNKSGKNFLDRQAVIGALKY